MEILRYLSTFIFFISMVAIFVIALRTVWFVFKNKPRLKKSLILLGSVFGIFILSIVGMIVFSEFDDEYQAEQALRAEQRAEERKEELKIVAAAEAKAKVEQEAKEKAAAEQKVIDEAAAKKKAEEDAKLKAEQEKKEKAAAEAEAKEKAASKKQAEEDAKKAEAEAKEKAEAAAAKKKAEEAAAAEKKKADEAAAVAKKKAKAEAAAAKKKADEEAKKKAEAAAKAKEEQAEKDRLANMQTVPFAQLNKNPDKYTGENSKYTGEILEIQESDGYGVMRLAVTPTSYGYDYNDVIWVEYEGETDFVEEDIVTIYGMILGSHSYTSQAGWEISVPSMFATDLE